MTDPHPWVEATTAAAWWLQKRQWTLGAAAAVAMYAFGPTGNDAVLAALHLIVLDFATGCIKGISFRALCSRRAYAGLQRKAAMVAAIALGHAVDLTIGSGDLAKHTLSIYVCGVETISILENVVATGVVIPEHYQTFLRYLLHVERAKDEKTP